MNLGPRNNRQASLRPLSQIDRICEEFKDAWSAGSPPLIRKFLDRVESTLQPSLFPKLLLVDCQERVRLGQAIPSADEIVEEFPEFKNEAFGIYTTASWLKDSLHQAPGIARVPRAEGVPNSQVAPTVDVGAATVPPRAVNTNDTPTHFKADTWSAARQAERPSESGQRFGDYEILEEIARGGMGVVYRARQISLNRVVALKMILAGQLADAEEVRRFRMEAESAGLLDHPNIVPVHEVGERNGQHFFSMSFVDGQSLAQRLSSGPLQPKEAAQLVEVVARAVAYAHQRGVIHRDLKPNNILLNEQGEPKITDFGLAKRLHGDSNLTATGQILGTPSYMPPEQAAGRIQDINETADVYSLGAILYCLLTGRPPFQAGSHIDTLMQVLTRDPVSPRDLNSSVPKDLETICLKCLQKESGKRYASAERLAEELGRFLRDEPIQARPVGMLEKAWRWYRRHPTIARLGAATFLTIIAAWLWTGRMAVIAIEARQEAEAEAHESDKQSQKARASASEAKAVLDFFKKHLLLAPREIASSFEGGLGRNVTVREALHAAEDSIADEFKKKPLLEATIRTTFGETYRQIGDSEAAAKQLELALKIRERELGLQHLDTQDTLQSLAISYRDAEMYDLSLGAWDKLGTHGISKESSTPSYQLGRNSMKALTLEQAGKTAEAAALANAILPELKRMSPKDAWLPSVRANLGVVLQRLDRHEEAVELLQRNVEHYSKKFGEIDANTLTARKTLAQTYEKLGRLEDAIIQTQASLTATSATLGPENNATLWQMLRLGYYFSYSRRHSEAIELHEKVLELTRTRLGIDNPMTFSAMSYLGFTYNRASRFDDALRMHSQLLERRKAVLGPSHRDTLESLHYVARNLWQIKKLDEAKELFEEALSKRIEALGIDHPDTHETAKCLARFCVSNEQFERALQLRREVLKETEAETRAIQLHLDRQLAHERFIQSEQEDGELIAALAQFLAATRELRAEEAELAPSNSLDPNWSAPRGSIVKQLEAAGGVLQEGFAICYAMPYDNFQALLDPLRDAKYRPVRIRPFSTDSGVKVAAVWTRDDAEWRVSFNLSRGEIERVYTSSQKHDWTIVDAGAWIPSGEDSEKYCAVWTKKLDRLMDESRDVNFGLVANEHRERFDALRNRSYAPIARQLLLGTDGEFCHTLVWEKPRKHGWQTWFGSRIFVREKLTSGSIQIDVSIAPGEFESKDRYANVLCNSNSLISLEVSGTLQECAQRFDALVSSGGRPVAVAGAAQGDREIFASVWHFPLLDSKTLDSNHPARLKLWADRALLRFKQSALPLDQLPLALREFMEASGKRSSGQVKAAPVVPVHGDLEQPGSELVQQIENAGGFIALDVALCYSLPFEKMSPVLQEMREAGYRPIRLRPFWTGKDVKVSAIWRRDRRDFKAAFGRSLEEIRNAYEQNRTNWMIVDTAMWRSADGSDDAQTAFGAVWCDLGDSRPSDRRAYFGLLKNQHWAAYRKLTDEGFQPVVWSQIGRPLYQHSMIWELAKERTRLAKVDTVDDYDNFCRQHLNAGYVQTDVEMTSSTNQWFTCILEESKDGMSIEIRGKEKECARRSATLIAAGGVPVAIAALQDPNDLIFSSIWWFPLTPDRSE